ncbi:MAG: hypothetical protein ACU843_07795 [Gammaproteobacteria bacterium]
MDKTVKSLSGILFDEKTAKEQWRTNDHGDLIDQAGEQLAGLLEESLSAYKVVADENCEISGVLLTYIGLTELRCRHLLGLLDCLDEKYRSHVNGTAESGCC